jgi:hypothetical protein
MNVNSKSDTYTPPCKSYGCNQNLASSDPASQYQRLKIIQNTVRVPSSLYTMNLGALNVYQKPFPKYGVNWNQMSDRRQRSFQPNSVGGGSFYHGSSTRHTITRNRPGAGCPGGFGVDIKHNSYDRYLNRIKGKGPVRRGPIPPDFGHPIVINPAGQRVQGGKTMKTSIVSGCNCPIVPFTISNELLIYKNENNHNMIVTFKIGDHIYAMKKDVNSYSRAVISAINGSIYTITFDDGSIDYKSIGDLLTYFPCNCDVNVDQKTKLANDQQIILDNNGYIIKNCAVTDPQIIQDYIQYVITNFYQNNK